MNPTLVAVMSTAFLLVSVFTGAKCAAQQDFLVLSSDGSKISAHADNIPLRQLLAKLAERSAIKIYVAPSLNEVPVTASFDNLPLEKGVQKLLRNFNFLASFKKDKDIVRLATLKIYPKGTSKGELIPIDTKNRVVEIGSRPGSSGGDFSREEGGAADLSANPASSAIQEQNGQISQGLSGPRVTSGSSAASGTGQNYDANGLKTIPKRNNYP